MEISVNMFCNKCEMRKSFFFELIIESFIIWWLKPSSDHFWNFGEKCIFSPKFSFRFILTNICAMASIFGSEWSWYFKICKTKVFYTLQKFLPQSWHIQQHKFEKKTSKCQKSILNPKNYSRKNQAFPSIPNAIFYGILPW